MSQGDLAGMSSQNTFKPILACKKYILSTSHSQCEPKHLILRKYQHNSRSGYHHSNITYFGARISNSVNDMSVPQSSFQRGNYKVLKACKKPECEGIQSTCAEWDLPLTFCSTHMSCYLCRADISYCRVPVMVLTETCSSAPTSWSKVLVRKLLPTTCTRFILSALRMRDAEFSRFSAQQRRTCHAFQCVLTAR